MADLLTHPFMYWVGTDAHAASVRAPVDTGIARVSTYEVLDPDPRGGHHCGPRSLVVYELADEAAVPPGSAAAEVDEFNTYYDDVHVPETMELSGYERASRYERYRELEHPEPGCPQFLAMYEADPAATEERDERRPARSDFSPGPPAWEDHETVWRLVYRLVAVAEPA